MVISPTPEQAFLQLQQSTNASPKYGDLTGWLLMTPSLASLYEPYPVSTILSFQCFCRSCFLTTVTSFLFVIKSLKITLLPEIVLNVGPTTT